MIPDIVEASVWTNYNKQKVGMSIGDNGDVLHDPDKARKIADDIERDIDRIRDELDVDESEIEKAKDFCDEIRSCADELN